MRPALQSVGVVLFGLLVAFALVAMGEAFNSRIFPLPPGIDPRNEDSVRQAMKLLPAGALVSLVLVWAVAAFAGTWVTARTAWRSPTVHGAIVGTILLIIGILNLMSLPHPAWVWMSGIAAFIIAGYGGSIVGSGSRRLSAR